MYNNTPKENAKILLCFLLFAQSGGFASASAGGSTWGIGANDCSSVFGIRETGSELCLDNWSKQGSANSIRIETQNTQSNEQAVTPLNPRREILAKRRTNNSRRRLGPNYMECRDASLATVQKTDATAITSPIVPLSINFDDQTGEEFADTDVMDRLVVSGLEMASPEKNDWIEWKEHSSTKKLLEEYGNDEMAILEQGEVLVYVGKSKKEGHGSKLPIIKTKSMLPLSAQDMADLLMDSEKVKIYNKMSLGRDDVKVLSEGTKVVCNLTKPPVAKSNMVSCTLMHSRQLSPEKHLVVSRAAPGMIDETMSELARNDILLGVNLLQDNGPNSCVMTAVTHVYSPALPTILAKSLGVSSAINFVKDIRASCKPVGS